MSNFWWMEPSWKDGCCADCGTNIWQSGGDPDWGYCFDCFTSRIEARRAAAPQPTPELPHAPAGTAGGLS